MDSNCPPADGCPRGTLHGPGAVLEWVTADWANTCPLVRSDEIALPVRRSGGLSPPRWLSFHCRRLGVKAEILSNICIAPVAVDSESLHGRAAAEISVSEFSSCGISFQILN